MGGRRKKSVDRRKDVIENCPWVKAVVSSCYSDNTAMTNSKQYGFKAAIAKPYEY
jgi:hypothetical protein